MQLDLQQLEFCDIAGLRALDEFCARQKHAGRRVRVTGARRYFRKVAGISGLLPECLEG